MNNEQLVKEANEMALSYALKTYRMNSYPNVDSVVVKRQGNYTVVLLNNAEVVGVSKRNPNDPVRPEVGIRKAMFRAVRHLVQTQG